MNSELNGSSYYRANPFYQQGYVPDSALRNRKSPTYLAQIPQGEKYFQPSNRKHFQRLGYYSTIAQEKIINNDNNHLEKSPAREKQFFRSLNINDIEGASPNTLISQAVKNRMKAQEHLMKRSKEYYQQQVKQKVRRFSQMQDKQKREEALQRMRKEKQPNYHELVKRMKTDYSEGKSSPTPQQKIKQNQPTLEQKYNQNYNYNQLQRTQNQIIELQKKLQKVRAENQKNNQKNNIQNLQNQSNNYQRNVPNQQEERYQQIQKNATSQQYQNDIDKKPYSRQNNIQMQKNPTKNLPINYSKINDPQNSYNQQIPQNYSNLPENIDRDRQYSLSDKQIPKANIQNNIYAEQLVTKQQEEQIYYDSRLKNRESRQRHRRYNPTYLSFGSASIGLAGKNIVGF